MSSQTLEIGTRRWKQMEKREHRCLLCDEQFFEDETRVLLNCSRYDELRFKHSRHQFQSKGLNALLNFLASMYEAFSSC